jgi:hypothetical protein
MMRIFKASKLGQAAKESVGRASEGCGQQLQERPPATAAAAVYSASTPHIKSKSKYVSGLIILNRSLQSA